MDIGIGLPTYIRGVSRGELVEWARRAEAMDFASLGTLDRLVYPIWDPLVCLSAAAAVTDRIRLITAVLISPYRNTAVLAKQAASVDRLSGGRLVLGLGLGGRDEDYAAANSSTHSRGKRLATQVEELRRIWAGEKRGFAGGIGPEPGQDGGPPLLVGGHSAPALRRAASVADGWIASVADPRAFAEGRAQLLQAWAAAGRLGSPRTVALATFGLGPDAQAAAHRLAFDYYAYVGERAARIAAGTLTSIDAIQAAVAGFATAGCDELVLFPVSADAGQVDLLAKAIRSCLAAAGVAGRS